MGFFIGYGSPGPCRVHGGGAFFVWGLRLAGPRDGRAGDPFYVLESDLRIFDWFGAFPMARARHPGFGFCGSKPAFTHTLERRIMKSKSVFRLAAILILVAGGCVVGDELTTFTLNSDGSADLVVFRSNLHSTEKGEKAEKELGEYQANFDKQADGDFQRMRDAGGQVMLASWVRGRAPFSNVVHARFPDTASLEKYWTVKGENDKPLITTQFRKDGGRRRLTFRITLPEKDEPAPAGSADAHQIRQALANGISETRFAVTEGAITSSRGFTVAGDRQSALLNSKEISDLIRTGKGKAELWLEWE